MQVKGFSLDGGFIASREANQGTARIWPTGLLASHSCCSILRAATSFCFVLEPFVTKTSR